MAGEAYEKKWTAQVRLGEHVYEVGVVDNYICSRSGFVCIRFSDGREYMTHWINVVMYRK